MLCDDPGSCQSTVPDIIHDINGLISIEKVYTKYVSVMPQKNAQGTFKWQYICYYYWKLHATAVPHIEIQMLYSTLSRKDGSLYILR